MDTEFHYYITGIVAHAAGFTEKESEIIASASEFVDENDVKIEVMNRKTKEVYENYVSQTMNILKPKKKLMRIYPVFHFVPGDPADKNARRSDGKMHILNTTPNNEMANYLMDEAFKASEDTRLYRIGIATHAYADTWAHQNFVGWYDYFNNIGLDIKPDIGHANAEHHPDLVAHYWEDDRLLNEEIDNLDRFLEAAENINAKYRDYTNGKGQNANSEWEALQKQLIAAAGQRYSGNQSRYRDQRLAAYKNIAAWLGDFDEAKWLNDAIDTNVRGLRDSKDGIKSKLYFFKDKYYWREDKEIESTDWYRFQEAVKEHQQLAMDKLKPAFANMDIDLHQH